MDNDIFSYHNMDLREELPYFGYKIHISATISNYQYIKKEVVNHFNQLSNHFFDE